MTRFTQAPCAALLLSCLLSCLAVPAAAQKGPVIEYRGQTVFKSAFGGKEVVAILERPLDAKAIVKYEYRLLASKKTSTMQKELTEAGDQGYEFVGMTVAKTLVGGECMDLACCRSL